MVRQDLKELKRLAPEYPFKAFACKWFSYLYWLEQIMNRYLSLEKIVDLTDQMIRFCLMKPDLFIGKESELSLPEKLGIPLKTAKRTSPKYICRWNEVEILWLQKTTKKATYNHFVPGDGKGNIAWDSLGLRPGRDDYRLMGKRVLVLDEEWCRKNWRSAA